MKTNIIILSLLLFFRISFAQDTAYEFGKIYGHSNNGEPDKVELRYVVRTAQARSVVKEKLSKASVMSDLYEGYPTSWVKNYVSIEISAICNGKETKAEGTTHALNKAQKELLKTADINTNIGIDVAYKHSNAATNVGEINHLYFNVTVVPEVEAEYMGGYEELSAYLKKSTMDQISKMNLKPLSQGTIHFMIDEEGKAINIKLQTSIGNSKMDKMLLEGIHKMPKWKPAKNAKGKPVKQRFELIVGDIFGGC